MANDFTTNLRATRQNPSNYGRRIIERGDIQQSDSRNKYRVVDPETLDNFNRNVLLPALTGIVSMKKESKATPEGRALLDRTHGIINAIREGAEDAARKRAFDNADVKIIDRTSPPYIKDIKKIDFEEIPSIAGPRSIGYSADDDTYYFPYLAGDVFSEVIKELGLQTNKGLWGPDGDVEYYTKQLREQGIDGNIPTGTIIKLQKRK